MLPFFKQRKQISRKHIQSSLSGGFPEQTIECGHRNAGTKRVTPSQGRCQMHSVIAAQPMLPDKVIRPRNQRLGDPHTHQAHPLV